MDTTAKAARIHELLRRTYGAPRTALDWETPWQLLVATILSAQTTDAQVNKATPELFSRWPGPADLAAADPEKVQEAIRSTGFFRNKAKSVMGAAAKVVREHGGEVPRTMAELTALPGVARKTANIVLTDGFGIVEGIAVDTHVKRLAARVGLTRETDPDKIERELCAAFERSAWADVNHQLISHGRAVCTAKKPACPECVLAGLCPRIGVAGQG